MLKTFKYRLFPTKKQVQKLNETLDECRWLYNHLLEMRKTAYERDGISLTCFQQQYTFPVLKQERPSLSRVHSQVLQNVAVRIDLAFKAFFRRLREQAEEPGYPRFKGKNRYDSFTFPQSGFSLTHVVGGQGEPNNPRWLRVCMSGSPSSVIPSLIRKVGRLLTGLGSSVSKTCTSTA